MEEQEGGGEGEGWSAWGHEGGGEGEGWSAWGHEGGGEGEGWSAWGHEEGEREKGRSGRVQREGGTRRGGEKEVRGEEQEWGENVAVCSMKRHTHNMEVQQNTNTSSLRLFNCHNRMVITVDVYMCTTQPNTPS